jgi:geranylgeranyl pyrophosphate synthase
VLTSPDLDALIADTEAEILAVIDAAEDENTGALYEMVRYHMGLDRDAPRGKRLRPLLGLLAYMSLAGDYRAALPGAVAVMTVAPRRRRARRSARPSPAGCRRRR